MAEYSCNSAECDGRIFDSREGTARCIHCGSEDIGRLDKPWRRPLILIVLFVLIGGGLGWYGLYLDDTDRENLHSVFGTGCKDLTACNYLQAPIFEDKDLCEYKKDFRDCQGLCINDMDGDDVCDEQEIEGCIDSIACNFDKLATEPLEICEYPEPGFTCAGDCVNDRDGDGICDENEVLGCTDPEACNFDADATEPDGSCWYREAGKSCEEQEIDILLIRQHEEEEDVPFMIVEKMPALGDCKMLEGNDRHQCTQLEMIKYISQNTVYPPTARADGIQGTVFVYFVVGRDGEVKDVRVLREVEPRLDEEALRVVKTLPTFEPALQRGKIVSVQYTIPVKFIIR